MDLGRELQDLKRRVADLEGAVNALFSQFRNIQPELAAIRSEATQRFDASRANIDRVVQRLDTMNTQIWSLRDDLPHIVGEALGQRGGGHV